jgi:hypothetical protein
MRPQAIFLALIVLLGAIAGLPSATAVAGSFSKPVRLPTKDEEWQFAINNQGEAVGVHGSTADAVVVQLDRSGRISHSWLVQAPAYTNGVNPSIALGFDNKSNSTLQRLKIHRPRASLTPVGNRSSSSDPPLLITPLTSHWMR